MEPKEIADGIKRAGYTQALLAEITETTKPAVNAVIYKRKGNISKNPIIRAAIATVLRRPVHEVFKDHVQYYCKVYTILARTDEAVNSKP